MNERLVRAEQARDALCVLYDDVARWRESGDARDLLYVIETMDTLEANAFKKQEPDPARAHVVLLRTALADLLRVVERLAYTKFEDTGRLASVETMARLALKETEP